MAGTMTQGLGLCGVVPLVSMESGLDGRNNRSITTRPKRPRESQWSPA